MSRTTDQQTSEQALEREVAHLRARLARLEQELVDSQARANAAVAKWQERAYWLDRWHVDLNALMSRPGASQVRGALRAGRSVTRAARRFKRSVLGP
jgi:hypothetical protein